MILHSLLYGIALPIVASVLVLGLFLVLFLWKNTVNATDMSPATADVSAQHNWAWLGAVALSLTYATGNVGLLGWPKFPAIEASQWLFWFLPAALLLALFDSVWKLPKAALWVSRALIVGGLLWLMFRTQVTNETWTFRKFLLYISLMTTVSLALWALWEDIARRLTDAKLGWLLMIFSIATSMALVLSNTAQFGQLGGVMVCGLGVWWVLSWLGQAKGVSVSYARGILPVYLLLFVGLSFAGYFYANLNNMTAGLLAASVVLLWLTARWVRPQKNWQQILVYSLAVLLPVGIALATLVVKEMQKPKDPYYGMLSSLLIG